MRMQMFADFRLYKIGKVTKNLYMFVRKDLYSICPGGFTFVIGSKEIPFDFDAGSTTEDNGLFSYESGRGAFLSDYELSDCYDEYYENLGLKRDRITPEFLSSVTDIQEFYVNFQVKNRTDDCDIGDNSDPDAEYYLELTSVSFKDMETGKIFSVDEKVLGKFNGMASKQNV